MSPSRKIRAISPIRAHGLLGRAKLYVRVNKPTSTALYLVWKQGEHLRGIYYFLRRAAVDMENTQYFVNMVYCCICDIPPMYLVVGKYRAYLHLRNIILAVSRIDLRFRPCDISIPQLRDGDNGGKKRVSE